MKTRRAGPERPPTPSPNSRRRRGGRGSKRGGRTGPGSNACARPPSSPSTHRAAPPACRSRSWPRSPRRPRPCGPTRNCWASGRATPPRACCRWPGSMRRREAGSTPCSLPCCRTRGRRGATSIWPRSSTRFRPPRSRKSASSTSTRSFRSATASTSRCGSTASSPRRGSSSGSRGNRWIRQASSSPRTAVRGSSFSRFRTSATRSGCSSSRCCFTRWSGGRGRRRARRACAPSSTWTRLPATFRRWPIRRPSRRC